MRIAIVPSVQREVYATAPVRTLVAPGGVAAARAAWGRRCRPPSRSWPRSMIRLGWMPRSCWRTCSMRPIPLSQQKLSRNLQCMAFFQKGFEGRREVMSGEILESQLSSFMFLLRGQFKIVTLYRINYSRNFQYFFPLYLSGFFRQSLK